MNIKSLKLPISVFILILFGLILFALQLLSSATQESSHLSKMYSLLLVINSVGSIVLLILVGVNAYSLARQLQQKAAGSRLTTRMVSLFVLLALAPAAIVFYFSVQFLQQGINSWFNVEIDRAMEDALELSQTSLDQRMRWHLKQTEYLGASLANSSEALFALDVGNLREASGALEMTLFSKQGKILAFSSMTNDILPNLPDEHIWLQLRQEKNYMALDTLKDEAMVIQVIVVINGAEPRYLQALYDIPERIADLADSIEFASVRYQEMSFLRNSLNLSFSLTLLLVLLLSLLAAIWVAFVSIRHIVAPVKALVKGTKAVAAGHYEQQLPVMEQDDLGFLVESFNQMTRRISQSRDFARAASFEVEKQRAYLETILTNVSAGVISFDAEFKIRTANQAAYKILHCEENCFIGYNLKKLIAEAPALADLFGSMQTLVEQADDIWQQRIAFLGASGRQELLCRGTPLFSQESIRVGAVVVFDDLTDLIQAQKNAAWAEVARRLAHEIKNPLTPIQLAAERLQHKLAKELPPPSADVLLRSTRTIVQQVEAMKHMVDDFSEYARPSKKHAEHINLQDLIQEVLLLYSPQTHIEFSIGVNAGAAMIHADPVSIRQVLHNLLKNAQEAMDDNSRIDIRLSQIQKNNSDYLELGIYDYGSGISEEQMPTIFEPYVTTKAKGTGLGLAIVKKIIEEHGGVIWLDTQYTQGAGFIIQLPVS